MQIINPKDDIYLNAMVEFQLSMAKESENLILDTETLRQGILSVIENPAKGKYFLAVEDNNLIGMLLTIPEWSDWRCRNILWIHSVYVPPEHRKRGIYRQLYLHLKQIVKENDDYAGLRLYVDKNNTQAINVYKKLEMSNEHYDLYEWLK